MICKPYECPAELVGFLGRLREFTDRPTVIYFLVWSNEVAYVGSTKNLAGRIAQHKNERRKFNQVFYFEVEPEDWTRSNQIETSIIRLLRPPQNIRSNQGVATEYRCELVQKYGAIKQVRRNPFGERPGVVTVRK